MYRCKIERVFVWLKEQHYEILSLTPESLHPSVMQKEQHMVFDPSLRQQFKKFE